MAVLYDKNTMEAPAYVATIPERVKKGDHIATQQDIFGDKIVDYFAPEDGKVIGKSVSPVNQTGGRILHIGII